MDLSGFTNDELAALAKGDMSALPDDKLKMLAGNAGTQSQDALPVVQEMHPDITFGQRFAVKNFGGDPQDAVNYLKTKHPEMKFTHIGDQLVARKPDEKQWHVLDPKNFDLQDITDLGADVATGIGSGLATAGAGLAAGAATGGTAAIPAAVAAGGASSAGLEYLRQKIGQALGVQNPDSVRKGDIALAGVTGAVAPWLLGTGATAGKIAAKAGEDAVAQKLLGKIGQGTIGQALTTADKAVATNMLGESQRGVVKNIPKIFGAFSGIGAQTIGDASKEAPAAVKEALGVAGQKLNMLKASDMMQQKGLSDVVEAQANLIKDKMFGVKQGLQDEFTQALDKVGGVNPQDYAEPFAKLYQELEASGIPRAKEDASKLKSQIQDLFIRPVVGADGKPVISRAGVRQYEPITNLSGKDAMRLKQYIKEMSSTFTTTEGKPLYSQDVMRAANETMRAVGDSIDKKLNEAGGKNLTGRYRDFSEMEREVMPMFEDPNKMYTFLRTADSKTKKYKSQVIDKIDRKYGLGIRDSIDQMNVSSVFGDPSWNPLSAKGSTSTSATLSAGMTGGGIGQALGGLIGGPIGGRAGHAAGYVAGSKLASPGAAKIGINAKNFISDLGLNTAQGKLTVGDLIRGLQKVPYTPGAANAAASMKRGNE